MQNSNDKNILFTLAHQNIPPGNFNLIINIAWSWSIYCQSYIQAGYFAKLPSNYISMHRDNAAVVGPGPLNVFRLWT